MLDDSLPLPADEQGRRLYRTVWRWHFYAGVFAIPLVLWLSCTGALYLFKPQIERMLDRPYDHLHLHGARATPEMIAKAAVAAVPDSALHYYELPPSDDAAVRVIVGVGTKEFRVYVQPDTRAILKVANEDHRPMRVLFYLHGELMAGVWGSYLVELAASWAVVLLLTGLYLGWPRETHRLAGILWVRTRAGQRLFWRDVHSFAGVWVSAFALFLILTGLPWAKGWGTYFKSVRGLTGTAAARQDWATSRAAEHGDRAAMNTNSLNTMDGMPGMEHAGHSGHFMHRMTAPGAYLPFDRLVPLAASMKLASSVEVMPAMRPGGAWTIKSDAQNRTLRTSVLVDPQTGAIVSRTDFRQRLWLDRVVGIGVAAHEGQLFGWANQMLGLLTAMALVLLCVSACVLWWRRRAEGVLGAPLPAASPGRPVWLVSAVVCVALYLPAVAISLVVVLVLERVVLRRMPGPRRWLGLAAG